MVKPINRNRARKARKRLAAQQNADRNAAFHGLSRAEKDTARAETARAERAHEGGRVLRLGRREANEDGPGE
ncbi:MAG: DUF4169 family protein [Pseudomonadota bacterium]